MFKPKLIVIDDEPAMAGFVRYVSEQAGFDTELYYHADIFKQDYKGDADIIVLDMLLPGVDGVEVIRYLTHIKCQARLILISGFDQGVLHSAQKLAVEQGLNVIGSLSKPFRHHELFSLLSNLSLAFGGGAGKVLIQHKTTVEELHSALLRNELLLHYQPKIDLRTHNVAGLEALVRWQHPKHGLIFPDLFIPMAEQNDLIDDITWTVLKQVSTQCQIWNEMGFELPIAVNMSASTLRELTLPERISNLISEYSISPVQIILEVTETALMQELVKSLDILIRLRMKDFRLSIDDFGTGYSSLIQLHRAPFSEIKIDRSFVMDMASDKEASAIVETVILLGHKLGMQVSAEGVETKANLEKLSSMGCDLSQGYYIARPQASTEITSWLTRQPLQNFA